MQILKIKNKINSKALLSVLLNVKCVANLFYRNIINLISSKHKFETQCFCLWEGLIVM